MTIDRAAVLANYQDLSEDEFMQWLDSLSDKDQNFVSNEILLLIVGPEVFK